MYKLYDFRVKKILLLNGSLEKLILVEVLRITIKLGLIFIFFDGLFIVFFISLYIFLNVSYS